MDMHGKKTENQRLGELRDAVIRRSSGMEPNPNTELLLEGVSDDGVQKLLPIMLKSLDGNAFSSEVPAEPIDARSRNGGFSSRGRVGLEIAAMDYEGKLHDGPTSLFGQKKKK